MPTKPLNIRQLASLLDVTPGTVSRALNDAPGVSVATRERVAALAAQMKYSPRPFRRLRTDSIGFLVSSSIADNDSDGFLARMITTAAQCCSRRNLYLHVDYWDGAGEAALPAAVSNNRVDGVLLAGYPPAGLCGLLRREGTPALVLHDSAMRTGLPCVLPNNFRAMHELTAGLLRQGRRLPAILLSDRRYPSVEHRYRGYCNALEDAGMHPDPALCVEGLSPGLDGGGNGVRMMLGRGVQPDAILCVNDEVAIGAMLELARRGIAVPAAVAVSGADDSHQSRVVEPSLTTIAAPWQATINLALDHLLAWIGAVARAPAVADYVTDAKVIWRDSTKGPNEQADLRVGCDEVFEQGRR